MKKFLFILLGITALSLSLYAQDAKKEKGIMEVITEETETLNPEMYVSNNVLYIKNAPRGAKLHIITIVGNKVREINIHDTDVSYELSQWNLPKAIYIFKLEGLVRKIVIR